MAWSNLLPATRRLVQETILPKAITATSDVPPPRLIIIWPLLALIGMPEPSAASTGSRTKNAFLAPPSLAAFITARRSVCVTPAGTEIITSGLKKLKRPTAFEMKYVKSALVM